MRIIKQLVAANVDRARTFLLSAYLDEPKKGPNEDMVDLPLNPLHYGGKTGLVLLARDDEAVQGRSEGFLQDA
jgi:hypothetical protein